MRHVATLGLCLGIPLVAFVVWIEASEPLVSSMTLDAGLAVQQHDDPFGISPLCKMSDRHDEAETDVARNRQLAWRDFHERFRGQFSSIEGEFGLSRMWLMPDTRRIKHSVGGGSNWTISQSSFGVQILYKPPFGFADGQISVLSLVVNEDLVNELERFPETDELQSLKYLGANPDEFVIGPSPELFEQAFDLISESISRTDWKLVRLELIGLLKHETPVAYASSGIPKMNELIWAPTAPLNAFEQAAIDRMRADAGEDVVIHEGNDEIQIVGALRAREQCQACHKVEDGELLGGFTYRLIRSREMVSPFFQQF